MPEIRAGYFAGEGQPSCIEQHEIIDALIAWFGWDELNHTIELLTRIHETGYGRVTITIVRGKPALFDVSASVQPRRRKKT